MKQVRLGNSGLKVSEICLGMMSYGDPGWREWILDEEAADPFVRRAVEAGITFFDTADIYSLGVSEEVTGRLLARHFPRREDYVLATKVFNPMSDRPNDGGLSRKHILSGIDASLRRLGVDHIDLYYQHRVDPRVPVEDTWGALAEIVAAGKVRHLGISEAAPATVRRAHAVHPVTAGQYEYSLWSRDPDGELLTTLRELGTGLVAYSPLGRGFLTGEITSRDQLAADDFRRTDPRFRDANFDSNLALVEKVRELAAARGATPAQVALAWVLAQGDDVVAIPGTKRRAYLEQNVAALDLRMSPDDLAELDSFTRGWTVAGDRYASMASVNG